MPCLLAQIRQGFDRVLHHPGVRECRDKLATRLRHVLAALEPQAYYVEVARGGVPVHAETEQLRAAQVQFRNGGVDPALIGEEERMLPSDARFLDTRSERFEVDERSRVQVLRHLKIAERPREFRGVVKANRERVTIAAPLRIGGGLGENFESFTIPRAVGKDDRLDHPRVHIRSGIPEVLEDDAARARESERIVVLAELSESERLDHFRFRGLDVKADHSPEEAMGSARGSECAMPLACISERVRVLPPRQPHQPEAVLHERRVDDGRIVDDHCRTVACTLGMMEEIIVDFLQHKPQRAVATQVRVPRDLRPPCSDREREELGPELTPGLLLSLKPSLSKSKLLWVRTAHGLDLPLAPRTLPRSRRGLRLRLHVLEFGQQAQRFADADILIT
ncbi:MAG TPA: hypothetical protein VN181_10845 [Thermoanaerobaculia bacterium]|nr:hypothetical protein [Thermoanaerobaculia bacterium]